MISIFTAVMNRNEILSKSIDNWLLHNIADEIVVVDWSSSIPFTYDHPSVKIYRVENEKYWILSQAFNLSAKLTKNDIIVKMDVDYEVTNKFSFLFPIPEKTFYSGTWIGPWVYDSKIDDNPRYLCGFLACHRNLFFDVGGYSEMITTYGYDDTDIQNRLSEKYSQLHIHYNNSGIYHKPHTDMDRMKNQNVTNIQEEIQKNIILSDKNAWSKNSKCTSWSIKNNIAIREVS